MAILLHFGDARHRVMGGKCGRRRVIGFLVTFWTYKFYFNESMPYVIKVKFMQNMTLKYFCGVAAEIE